MRFFLDGEGFFSPKDPPPNIKPGDAEALPNSIWVLCSFEAY